MKMLNEFTRFVRVECYPLKQSTLEAVGAMLYCFRFRPALCGAAAGWSRPEIVAGSLGKEPRAAQDFRNLTSFLTGPSNFNP